LMVVGARARVAHPRHTALAALAVLSLALTHLHDSSNDRLDLAPGPASGCLAWQGRRQVHRLRVAVPARCCRRTGAWRGTHG